MRNSVFIGLHPWVPSRSQSTESRVWICLLGSAAQRLESLGLTALAGCPTPLQSRPKGVCYVAVPKHRGV